VVVPIFENLSSDDLIAPDPWRMLAQGSGMLVAWEPAPSNVAKWGALLSATSGFAKQLNTVVQRAGASMPKIGETLFRLELPAGQTIENLVPAVGGGFRAMTKDAGKSGYAGQARLFPDAGAAVALGPMLAVIALSVGAEMLAGHQQQAKLSSINGVVDRLESHELDKLIAVLDSAEGVLHDSMNALLDKLDVPEAVGLGSTAGSVKETKALVLNWLAKWEAVAEQFERSPRVDVLELRDALGKTSIGGFEAFGLLVQLAYRSLALDSRVHVVAMAEATLRRPEDPLEHFQESIQRRLTENGESLQRLSNVVRRFATMRLTVGATRIDKRHEPSALQAKLVQLAFAVGDSPQLPPLLTSNQHLVVEAVRRSDGSIMVLRPRPEAVE
jgi:hypothetical protein